MTDKKKKMAAIASVTYYIQSEQEAAVFAQTQGYAPSMAEAKEDTPIALNLWGISGRQQQMQMRSMLHMKAFHGAKQKF